MEQMDGKFLIMLKFGGSIPQRERLYEILDENLSPDDFHSLRRATIDLHNCNDFVESSVDMTLGRNYLGLIIKNKNERYRIYHFVS